MWSIDFWLEYKSYSIEDSLFNYEVGKMDIKFGMQIDKITMNLHLNLIPYAKIK